MKKRIGIIYDRVKEKDFFTYEIAFFLSGSIGSKYFLDNTDNRIVAIESNIPVIIEFLSVFIISYNLINILKRILVKITSI